MKKMFVIAPSQLNSNVRQYKCVIVLAMCTIVTYVSRGNCDSYIKITCPCYIYPLTPHLYIVKLGFTGVFFFFSLIFPLKHRLCSNVYPQSMF